MNREHLEIKITEAIDGLLSGKELKELKMQLQNHPDLMEAWELLKEPVQLEVAFPLQIPNAGRLEAIQNEMEQPFAAVVVQWFPRYLIAAALAVFVMFSLFQMGNSPTVNDQFVVDWLHAPETELVFSDIDPILIPESFENGVNP